MYYKQHIVQRYAKWEAPASSLWNFISCCWWAEQFTKMSGLYTFVMFSILNVLYIISLSLLFEEILPPMSPRLRDNFAKQKHYTVLPKYRILKEFTLDYCFDKRFSTWLYWKYTLCCLWILVSVSYWQQSRDTHRKWILHTPAGKQTSAVYCTALTTQLSVRLKYMLRTGYL